MGKTPPTDLDGRPEKKPKAKAAPKKKRASSRATPESVEHSNMMQRMRYHMNKSKAELKAEYGKLTTHQKRDHAKQWQKTGNFDFVATLKKEGKSESWKTSSVGTWFSQDQIYRDEGWTEENQHTPIGQRAAARANAIISGCKKMKGYVRDDPQHGDCLYKRLRIEEADVSEHHKDCGVSKHHPPP